MSKNKAKGSLYEREVAAFLVAAGFDECGRIYATGQALDVGDICGIPGFVLQCKNRNGIDLAAYVDEANHQRDNAGEPFGAAVIKRRMRSVGDSYVAMDLATFARLLADVEASHQPGD